MIEYIGPFQDYRVSLNGYEVPLVGARETDDGKECHICLDNRFGIVIPAEIAEQVIWLVANAHAIGAGYSCHGENSNPVNPHKVKMTGIEFRTPDGDLGGLG
jgi:hypothetical protein